MAYSIFQYIPNAVQPLKFLVLDEVQKSLCGFTEVRLYPHLPGVPWLPSSLLAFPDLTWTQGILIRSKFYPVYLLLKTFQWLCFAPESFKSWIWHTKLSTTWHLLAPSPNLNTLHKVLSSHSVSLATGACHMLFSFSHPGNGIATPIPFPPLLTLPWGKFSSYFHYFLGTALLPAHFTLGATLSHTLLFTVLWIHHCSYHTTGWRFSTSSSSTSVILRRRTLPWRIHFCSLCLGLL